MVHKQNIVPYYFARVAEGTMTFLIIDRNEKIQMGDEILLRECEQKAGEEIENSKLHTGKELKFIIGYIHQINRDVMAISLLFN